MTIIVIAALAGSSCTKTLDLTPVSQISTSSFWKTPDDANGANAGMYADIRSQAINNLFLWGEARSDAMGPSIASPVFQNWYLNILTSNNAQTIFSGASTDWLGLYTVIHDANLMLQYVPGISFPAAATKNNLLAQAYSMRAYVYFVMARTWGGVPMVTEANIDLGKVQRARSPVDSVIARVKADIASAEGLFPDNSFPANRSMWSLPALEALKADVYLWTAKQMKGGNADLQTALVACNAVQQANVSLLPKFGDVFAYTNAGNPEVLFSIRRTYQEDNESSIYAWMYILPPFIPATDAATLAAIGVPGGAPYMAASAAARNVLSADDTRRSASLIDIYTYDASNNPTFSVSIVSKFNGTVISGTRYFINDYIVYRYADVLLMKAEAENALGTDPSAEMNLVRARAYGSNYSNHVFASTGNQAQNDDSILNERFRELMFEGKRWWDLVRFGQAFNLVPSLQGRNATDNHLLLFPINQTTMSLNASLVQNPGY